MKRRWQNMKGKENKEKGQEDLWINADSQITGISIWTLWGEIKSKLQKGFICSSLFWWGLGVCWCFCELWSLTRSSTQLFHRISKWQKQGIHLRCSSSQSNETLPTSVAVVFTGGDLIECLDSNFLFSLSAADRATKVVHSFSFLLYLPSPCPYPSVIHFPKD